MFSYPAKTSSYVIIFTDSRDLCSRLTGYPHPASLPLYLYLLYYNFNITFARAIMVVAAVRYSAGIMKTIISLLAGSEREGDICN